MKQIVRTLLLACATLGAVEMQASGGPDAYGYTWTTSLDVGGPTYNWIDITSYPGVQTVSGLADDNSAPSMINIGFNFHYYWNDYSQLKVGSNGWLGFNNISNIASCFPTIPTAGGPGDNYLAPFMSDLNFTGAGNPGVVQYWTNNVDSFVVSYINVPFWSVNSPSWSGPNSFQVILCNSDSSITYQYGSLSPSSFLANASCVDMTIGIENSTGSIGLQVHSDVMPPSNYAIHFDYPATVLLSIQDVLPRWNQQSGNGSNFILQNVPTSLSSDIRNAGNAAVTTTVNLQSQILDATLTQVLNNTGSIPSMAAGDDSVYTFATAWTPTTAGQYTNRTTTSNSQDINSANDVLNTELDVVNPCNASMSLSYVTGNTPDGSINWNGGGGDDGVAVYFVPPVYPYTVSSLQYYISSNVSDGYIAEVYDDDGPNGSAGTLLFSTTVAAGSVTSSAWNTVTVSPAVTLPSGGFYVVWLQGGTTIFLGTETAGPRCHHNFEILDAAWAQLRYDDAQDLLIRAGITGYTNAPTAAFSSSVAGQTGNFTDNSTGLVTSWSWDFGDSQTSTQQNPSHMYASAGTYTVCLTAASPCSTDQICQTVDVCIAPIASYSNTTSQLSASFTDLSAGSVTSWFWDFGDGNNSTQQNPSHTYAIPGTYTACLIVSDNCGDVDSVCQTVVVCAQPVADFASSNNLYDVTFTDQTSNSPVSWVWDFGDSQTSNQQNPVHTYAAAGTYNVCLIATNACGDADTSCQTVIVCDMPVTLFNASQNEDTVFTTDQSTGTIVSWFWDFGDGNNSTMQNAMNEYATGGAYTICLTTIDACGNTDSSCQQVFIVITSLEEGSGPAISGSFPNPVQNQITVSFSNPVKNGQLEIFDQTGRLVQTEQNVSGSQLNLEVGQLPSGIYLLRVTDANGSASVRFIRE